MESFAVIYPPNIKKYLYYTACNQIDSTMYIENFRTGLSYYFKEIKNITIPTTLPLVNSNNTSTTASEYQDWVIACQEAISQGFFTKLVAAQIQVEDVEIPFNSWKLILDKLVQTLPDTLVYFYYLEGKIWIGASPELIGEYQNSKFKTISIAGTKLAEDFTNKEREEHAIVSRFIHQQFSDPSSHTLSSPHIRPFGPIRHLVQVFDCQVSPDFNFENAIHQIHPSPALAGFPKQESIAFLKKNEPINRDFYTGLISLCHEDIKLSYAAIRCACISANQISYYAGAGITEDSIPEDEWQETLAKISVLKNIIHESI